MRIVNKACVDLIKTFEGLSLKPYLDSVKIPTIGYGTILYPNGKAVTLKDVVITESLAEAYLNHEINKKSTAVENMVKVVLNDNEFAALVSFAYNVGTGALQGSTLLKLLNANADRTAVADQLLRWNKAGGKELSGLTRRRQAERSLFLQPVAQINSNLLPDVPSDDEIINKLKELEEDILKK